MKLLKVLTLSLLGEIKDRIRYGQLAALRAVNRELIELYWDIGRLIIQRQQGETWGRGIVENLAADLRKEFPGISGFSAANLWRIKNFYEAYRHDPKLAPLVREISWSKNLRFFGDCAPKKWPLRGSSAGAVAVVGRWHYASKSRFAIRRVHHARPIERSLQRVS